VAGLGAKRVFGLRPKGAHFQSVGRVVRAACHSRGMWC
jgi:hypothetical protein